MVLLFDVGHYRNGSLCYCFSLVLLFISRLVGHRNNEKLIYYHQGEWFNGKTAAFKVADLGSMFGTMVIMVPMSFQNLQFRHDWY